MMTAAEESKESAAHVENQRMMIGAAVKARILLQGGLTAANALGEPAFSGIGNAGQAERDSACDSLWGLVRTAMELHCEALGRPLSPDPPSIAVALKRSATQPLASASAKKAKKHEPSAAGNGSSDWLKDAWTKLDGLWESYRPQRDELLNKWARKISGTRTGQQFKVLDRDLMVQVRVILEDENRMIKRSRLRRTKHKLNRGADDGREDIYDDTDFYQLLLKDVIDTSSNDPLELSRRNVALRKLTKGAPKPKHRDPISSNRSLRFNVHDKIVNFTTPTEDVNRENADVIRDALFARIFGQHVRLAALGEQPDTQQPSEPT